MSSDSPQVYSNTMVPQSGIAPLGPNEVVVPGSEAFHTSVTSGRWSDTISEGSSGPVVTVSVGDSTLTRYGACDAPDLDAHAILAQATNTNRPPPSPPSHLCPPVSVPGRVTWWISYTVASRNAAPSAVTLGWGSQKVYEIAPSKWKLTYTPFPLAAALFGGPLEVSMPECGDFLCTAVDGNQLTVSTKPLGDIKYPPSAEGELARSHDVIPRADAQLERRRAVGGPAPGVCARGGLDKSDRRSVALRGPQSSRFTSSTRCSGAVRGAPRSSTPATT